jgi:hypothetical protein
LWPKSSITATPFASPTRSKRRRRPVKLASALTASGSELHARADAARDEVEGYRKGFGLQVFGAEVGGGVDREGGDLAAGEARCERGGVGVVGVDHRGLGLGDEGAEEGAEFVERLVVEADIVEHGDLRRVMRDRAVAFVDLADEGVALAD